MNRSLIAAAILLAGASVASSQTIVPCIDTDPMADQSGACAAAPMLPSTQPGTLDQGAVAGSSGSAIDPGTTSAIPQPATPQGMQPLVVPNDPLGHGVEQKPLGGSTGNINGNSAISSPTIR